jgi:hypothetical protein
MAALMAEKAASAKQVEVPRSVWWLELVGSAFIFASVYLILYLLYQIATAAAASYFGLDPVVRISGIEYRNSPGWYPHAVKRTFVVGAILMASVSLVFFATYAAFRKHFIFIRLFLLWSATISVAMVAQRLIGVLVSVNFEFRKLGELGFELSVFGAYMYYVPQTYWFMAFCGLMLLMVAGFLLGKPFLQTAWSSDLIGEEGTRFRFIINQVILPYVIGAAVVTLVTFPSNIVPNFVAFVSVGILLFFSLVRAMLLGPMPIPRQKTWERWPLVPIALLAVVVLLIKTVFSYGLPI